MKKTLWVAATYVAAALLLLSCGCVRLQIKPPPDTYGKLQTIAVVPMEAPPLDFYPEGSSDAGLIQRLAEDFYPKGVSDSSSFLSLAPERKIRIGGGRGAVMISGILMVMDLMELKDALVALQDAPAIAESLEIRLGYEETWIPTIVLSQEAAAQLTLEGKAAVILERKIQEIPGITNRNRTIFMENWMAPIRAWYNQNISSIDYKSYRERKVDAVLEVGLSNLMLSGSILLVSVMLKLIDPATGKVLGRARNAEIVEIKKMDKLFIDDGLPFKELFAATGKKPVSENLKYLGILSERR